jgi:opacity protein-like surface antigen
MSAVFRGPGARFFVLRVAVFGGLALAAALAAHAQDRPFSVSVLGGVTFPISAAGDAMGIGWNLGVAGEIRLTPALRVRADYLYDRYTSVDKTIDVGLGPMLPAFRQVAVHAKSQMHFVSFDLAWTRENLEGRRFFVMGGPTIFRRRVQLTTPADDTGIASACEPQWLQCSAESIGFDRWLGIKESIDYGFNVGAGVSFRTGLTAALVIEARYYYVSGPSFTSTAGGKESASAMFVPVSVGLRF